MTSTEHDAVLLDLDGVVYSGDRAVDGAPEALARLRGEGTAVRFVTNNASRTPEQVADKLVGVGVAATAEEVLGSARAAVELLLNQVGLDPGALVAVVGGDGLLVAVREHGLVPVPVLELEGRPAAVVQGFSPDLGWAHLAAATRLVRDGVPWVATNLDRTIPTATGVAPGNGILVGAVAEAAGQDPVAVAGKPEPHLFTSAARSCGSVRPLVVGDRLDTDIAGGRAAGFTTALVLTGVHDAGDALVAEASHRPDLLLGTLADLWSGAGRDRALERTDLLQQGWRELAEQGEDDAAARDALVARWRAQLSPTAG